MVERAVYRIGIDKAAIKPEQVKSSARRLARLVKIDASGYAARVAGAGKEAFVEAIVLRTSDKNLPLASDIRAIPGGTSIQDDLMLAPNRDFARPVIGVVGDATEEIVDASGGTVVGGDQVGLSGLQKRYDTQLRGTPGVRVQLVATKNSGSSASPSPTPSQSPSTAPKPVTVFEVQPVAGKPLTTTLQVTLQKLAEKTLSKTKPAAALVAIRPSTGAVLVAANNSATNGQSLATVGQNPPGSTFKVVTSLALLRAGLTPDSPVTCPRTVNVNGREFHNYSDYPSSHLGSIDLRTALAKSCNTAFIGQRGKVKGSALADAAGSLGVGIDYDVGFPSFFGSVPEDSSSTGRAAALIGQGKVEASPLAMAAVVASVYDGKTVLPHLIKDQQADSKAKPLTKGEAAQLRAMMRGVVDRGQRPGPRRPRRRSGDRQDRDGRVRQFRPVQDPRVDDRRAGRPRRRRLRQRRKVRLTDRRPVAADVPQGRLLRRAILPRSSPMGPSGRNRSGRSHPMSRVATTGAWSDPAALRRTVGFSVIDGNATGWSTRLSTDVTFSSSARLTRM